MLLIGGSLQADPNEILARASTFVEKVRAAQAYAHNA